MATIAALVGEMFEDAEYAGPEKAFTQAGHKVVNVGIEAGQVMTGERGREHVTLDMSIDDASVSGFDALFIPGGHSPDNLRVDDRVVNFVRDFVNSGKPVFAICHAPQLLITADVLKGRRVAGWKSIIQDIRNAGAEYVDQEVVIDGNIISSRNPKDIPAFNKACLQRLGEIAAAAPAAR